MGAASFSHPPRDERESSARDSAEARRRRILDALVEVGTLSTDKLATTFSVSRMTIHRDIQILVEEGQVRKIHGGITIKASALMESSVTYRAHHAEEMKYHIGRKAASFIEAGQAVIIDDSTTSATLLPLLAAFRPLTVITNGLDVVQQLSGVRGVKVTCLGGDYVAAHKAFFGLLCEQAVQSLRANTLFMSTSTIHGMAAYHQDQGVVKVKRAMMEMVDTKILMVDSTKFSKTAVHKVADLTAFDHVLTDRNISRDTLRMLRDNGVNIDVCE